jgi:hypothetical protein
MFQDVKTEIYTGKDFYLANNIFILAKKVYSWKEHTKMSKIAKFGCEML